MPNLVLSTAQKEIVNDLISGAVLVRQYRMDYDPPRAEYFLEDEGRPTASVSSADTDVLLEQGIVTVAADGVFLSLTPLALVRFSMSWRTSEPTMPNICIFKDVLPTRAFYWIFANQDGSRAYYKTEMTELHKHIALYGIPGGHWAYEAAEGCDVY